METEQLPYWVVIGSGVLALASFVADRLFKSGRFPQKQSVFEMGGFAQTSGLGLNYCGWGFLLFTLGAAFTRAPAGSFLERHAHWLFLFGFFAFLPVVYWEFRGYPERLKPEWYRDLESRSPRDWWEDAGESDPSADALIPAGPEGWKPSSQAPREEQLGELTDAWAGLGTSRLKIDGPRSTPIVLEMENISFDPMELTAGRERSSTDFPLAVVPSGRVAGRTILDDRELAEGERLPVRYLRIESTGPWRIAMLPDDDLRSFTSRAEGVGFDVLRYEGPPAIGVLSQDGSESFSVKVRGSDLIREPGIEQILCSRTGLRGRVALPSGVVLQIGADGTPWTIEARPVVRWEELHENPGSVMEGPALDELRCFDVSISGELAEVLFYSGESGRLQVEHAGDGPFGIDRLNSSLTIKREVLTTVGDHRGEIKVPQYSLLQVRGGSGSWSLRELPS
jgi:hypothetical protein